LKGIHQLLFCVDGDNKLDEKINAIKESVEPLYRLVGG
jgi:hypothetical protein